MNELTASGVSIIMVSSELPEVLGMSDRIVVVHEGRIAGELLHDEADQENRDTCNGGHKNNGCKAILKIRFHNRLGCVVCGHFLP